MIVVKVELWKRGNPNDVTELARMNITNVGGDDEIGNYTVHTLRGRSAEELERRVINRTGTVLGHARLRDHVWSLVGKALSSVNYAPRKR